MGIPGPSVGRRSFNYVWDSSVLGWVQETQPGSGGGGGSTIVTVSTGSVAAQQSGVWTSAPSSTGWASSAGFHFDGSGNLNIAGSFSASTTVQVSSLAGKVTVAPIDTNVAVNSGFHFDASGNLNIAGSFSASTTVQVSSLAGKVLVDQNSTVWQAQVSTVQGRVLVDQNSTTWQVQSNGNSTVFPGAGSTWVTNLPDMTASLVIASSNSSVSAAINDRSGVSIYCSSLTARAATISVTVTNDNTNYTFGIIAGPVPSVATAISMAADGMYYLGFCAGLSRIKLKSGAAWTAGNATFTIRAGVTPPFMYSVVAQGDVSAAATDTGNPQKIGGKAASSLPSAVGAGQRVNAYFDLTGRLVVQDHLFDNLGQGIESSTRSAGLANSTMRGVAVRSLVPESTSVFGAVAVTSSGDITVISSATTAVYVYAYTLQQTISTAQTALTYRVLQGSTGQVWQWITPAGIAANTFTYQEQMMVNPPAYLFRTAAGNPLLVNKGTSTTVGGLNYNLAFWRE